MAQLLLYEADAAVNTHIQGWEAGEKWQSDSFKDSSYSLQPLLPSHTSYLDLFAASKSSVVSAPLPLRTPSAGTGRC